MTTRNETLNRLVIPSPCLESWQAMSGDGHTRFCSQCQKHVYDLAALEAREIEALVEATQGRFCARITRDRFGRMITREPDVPPFHLPPALSVRRASPVVAAVVTAVVGLTGAGWAQAPVSAPAVAPVAGESAAPDPAYPAVPGGAVLDGRVVDDHGFALPGATIVVRHPEEGWRFVAVTDAQGRFQLRDLPSGVYDVEAELEGFDFEAAVRLELGPGGRQITLTGALSETDQITVTFSVDPIYGLRPLPADPRLRPELGVDEAEWRAMRYIADAVHDGALQELVTRAITQVEAARRELAAGSLDAAGEKRLRARIAAVEEELRSRFAQVLSRGK